MNEQDIEQQMERFAVGQRVGECLARGCTALLGTVQALGPVQPAPGEGDARRAMPVRSVDLAVQQRLHGEGPAPAAAPVRLQHAAPPAVSKTAEGPWLAWQGVQLAPGAPLLVLRWAADAPRPSWAGRPDDVALALSDAPSIAAVRTLIERHDRRLREGGDPVALARGPGDALFAGYLSADLMERETPRDPDRAALALGALLGNPALPAPARPVLIDALAGAVPQLGPAARKGATDALLGAAAGDDAESAQAGLQALLSLAEQRLLDLRTGLSPLRQRRIVERYRAWRAEHAGSPRNAEFEAQVGMR